MVTALFLFGHIVFLLLIVFGIASFFTGAPYLPTPRAMVQEMMKIGAVGKNDVLVDLGSGDGRLIIAAAKLGARGTGWEINPVLALISLVLSVYHGVISRIQIRWGDYRRADLHSATVVVMYSMYGKHITAISRKCKKELAPDTRILSYQFELPDFRCVKKTPSGIFLYRMPNPVNIL